jgi:HlyD family secretion protein
MSSSSLFNSRQYVRITILGVMVGLMACGTEEEATELVYQAVPVETRDIIVSAEAAGVIEPDTLVEVKSKASGEILEIRVETGQKVERGALLIRVDQRTPTNALAQSQANFEVAKARLENATSQRARAEDLFQSRSITETEYEATMLNYANAKAEVVGAEVQVDNDRIRLDDTDVRAPISGTIIEKQVERGQVISSPTQNVGGGTVLLKMADLNLVQVRTLVDETDIGKIKAGLPTTVTVAAYPTQPFQGEVVKIEPLAVQQQNVTMFPVIIRIRNTDDLLRPGMNAEVEIHIGRRDGVLAVPNAALRTQRDVNSAAMILGLSPDDVREQLAAETRTREGGGADSTSRATLAASTNGDSDSEGAAVENTIEFQGRTITLPEGVTRSQVEAIFEKFRSGKQPNSEEMAIMRKVRSAMGGAQRGGGRRRGSSNEYQFGGNYVVFVWRNGRPEPVNVRTGLTDLDYSEVVSGLTADDSVLVLPSASLVQSQQAFQERIKRFTGGGLPGMSKKK